MPLHLIAKEVAQANVDEFDRLGAFLGETKCRYHYDDDPSGRACAIGIMDAEGLLGAEHCNFNVYILTARGVVSTDDKNLLLLIQSIHDFKILTHSAWVTLEKYLSDLSMPDSIGDLIKSIDCPRDLTPEIYKEIMRRLAVAESTARKIP